MNGNEKYIAIYSRKSKFTGKGESIGNQIELCKEYIQTHYTEIPQDHILVYEDEGFSGGNLNRPDLKKMMEAARQRRFKAIIVYRLDRISRNISDFSSLIEELSRLDIAFISIREQFDTGTPMGRAMMYIASVFSQLERETIAERIRDNMHELAKTGRWLGGTTPTGYASESVQKVTIDGKAKKACKLKLIPEEAEIVLKIYNLYLNGYSIKQIKEYLEKTNIPTKQGKTVWGYTVVANILTNERYCGDMLLQKTFTENCITKKVKKNRGEKTKYLIANNHTPIVSSEMFKKVQREMARRRGKRQTSDKSLTALGKYSGKFALSELLVCGDCGSPYKRITWVKNGVSRKVWRCLSRVDHGKKFCAESPALDEKKLHAAICRGLTKLLENKDEVLDMIISNLASVITGDDDVLDTGAIENQIHYLKDEVNANVQLLITTEGDKQKYVDVISQLNDKIAVLNKQLEAEREKIAANPNLKMQIEDIKETLSNTELCFSEYDDVMIRRLVGLIRVMKDKSIVIFLKGGLSITEMVA